MRYIYDAPETDEYDADAAQRFNEIATAFAKFLNILSESPVYVYMEPGQEAIFELIDTVDLYVRPCLKEVED